MRKIGGAVVSISLWLLTATVLIACVLVGRLVLAPIDVGFAREQIVARSAAILPGWKVNFSSARVGWDWKQVRPWVVLEEIDLIDRRNRLTARLPKAEVRLGFDGVLSGIGVSTIKVDRASVRVTDLGGFSDATDDSLFDDLFSETGIPQPEIFIPLTEAFNRFTLRLLANAPSLERVSFDGLAIRLYRGENLSEAQISVSAFDLQQSRGALNLTAQLEASIGGNPVKTRLVGRANPEEGDLSLLVSLNDIYPSTFPSDSGLPSALQYLNFPLDLSIELDLDSRVGLQSAGFEAELGEGEIFGGDVFPQPAAIQYGLIGATYDVSEKVLVFDQIDLELGGQRVDGGGLMYWHQTGDAPGMQFELRTSDLPILEVLKYWPIARHPDGRERGARAWISQHMLAGSTHDVVFRIDTAPSGVGTFEEESPYQLTFSFDELDSKFIRTMPPILGASGSALLTKTRLDIVVDDGQLLGMPVNGTTIKLRNIDVRDAGVGDFNVFVRGDVQTVMELIDYPPLQVASKANLDIERLGGTATVKATVRAPLINGAPKESITYDVTAQLSDASVDELLSGEGLTDAELSLRVDQDALSAAGKGMLNGVPVNLRWEEDFAAGRLDSLADTSLIVMSGSMDAQDMLALGVDVTEFLEGEIQAEASFQGRNLQFTKGTFAADASEAILKIPQLSWQKPVGSPATINGGVLFADEGTTVAPLLVQGEDIDLVASMSFGPRDSGLFNAELQARRVGRNQFVATLDQTENRPLNIDVHAQAFDLAAFLQPDLQETVAVDHGVIVRERNAENEFDLKLEADSILLENGEHWDSALLELSFRDDQPVSLTLDASVGEANLPLVVSVQDTPDPGTGMRPFQAEAADGGQVLRGLGFFAHINGGKLTLEAQTKGWGDEWQLQGQMDVGASTLVAKAALGQQVTEGTVSGLDSYLDKGPLQLDVLDVPFSYDGRILEFDGLKANGPTLGLTMEGEIATVEGLINVNGVVIPAYGINSLLGNIPLVGGLFSGGDGKGLFGVAYRVKGTTDAPDVNVNALSGLAPGFLRLLFEGRKGRVADVETPDAEKGGASRDEPVDPESDGGALN